MTMRTVWHRRSCIHGYRTLPPPPALPHDFSGNSYSARYMDSDADICVHGSNTVVGRFGIKPRCSRTRIPQRRHEHELRLINEVGLDKWETFELIPIANAYLGTLSRISLEEARDVPDGHWLFEWAFMPYDAVSSSFVTLIPFKRRLNERPKQKSPKIQRDILVSL